MRIMAGKFRGRNLVAPDTPATHPMSSRARLAVFNTLGDAEGITVLDLFAGSGALGFEALSQGAESVTFVESNPKAIAAIEKNRKNLGVEYCTRVIKSKVKNVRLPGKFDIVFADPPYHSVPFEDLDRIPDFIYHGGLLMLSHPGSLDFSSYFGNKMEYIFTRRYASAYISLFRRTAVGATERLFSDDVLV